MKIGFIIGYPPKYKVFTWREIKKYKSQKSAYDEATYHLIKSLEHEDKLEEEILKSRKRLNIPPDGFDWKEYEESKRIDPKKNYSEKEISFIRKFREELPLEIKRIKRFFKFNERISDQVENLIKTGCVYPENTPLDIEYWLSPDGELVFMDKEDREEMKDDPKVFRLHINRQVSQNTLIKFIKDNWNEMYGGIKKLPQSNRYYVSRRDLRIVELRDKNKLSYTKIANKITEEFGIDEEGGVNADSAKTAYRRAKIKMQSITHNQESNKK